MAQSSLRVCVFLLSEEAQYIGQSGIVQQLLWLLWCMGFLLHYTSLAMVYPTFSVFLWMRHSTMLQHFIVDANMNFFQTRIVQMISHVLYQEWGYVKCGHVGQLKSMSGDAHLCLESPQCRVSTEINLLDEQVDEQAGSLVHDDTDVGPPTPEKVYKRKRSPTLPEISNCLLLTEGHEDTLENGTQFVLRMFIKPFSPNSLMVISYFLPFPWNKVVHAGCCGNCKRCMVKPGLL